MTYVVIAVACIFLSLFGYVCLLFVGCVMSSLLVFSRLVGVLKDDDVQCLTLGRSYRIMSREIEFFDFLMELEQIAREQLNVL